MTLFETIFLIALTVFVAFMAYYFLKNKRETDEFLSNLYDEHSGLGHNTDERFKACLQQHEITKKDIEKYLNDILKEQENQKKINVNLFNTLENSMNFSQKGIQDLKKEFCDETDKFAKAVEADIDKLRKHTGLDIQEQMLGRLDRSSGKTYTEPIYADHLKENTPVEILQNQNEFLQFMNYFKTLDPKHVVEIGSFFGGTLYHFIKNAKLESISSIDLYIPESDGRYQQMIESKEKWNDWEREFGVEIKRFIGDSKDTEIIQQIYNLYGNFEEDDVTGNPQGCKEGVVDMLFIDGDHSYEGLKADFENYKGIVRKGGIIVIHDISCIETVHDFWKEIVESNTYVTNEIISDNDPMGIGIIMV